MTVQVDRSLRLPDGEYFAERERKTGIAIHHTVCGAAHTTIELWRNDRTPHGGARRVAGFSGEPPASGQPHRIAAVAL
jgi:hypothetical protein